MCMNNTNSSPSTRLTGKFTYWEILAARDIQINTLFVSAIAGLLVLNIFSAIKQHYSGVKAEAVGYRSLFEPGWLVRLRFVRGSTPIIRDGYRKFRETMFRVLRNDGDILIISNKHLDQLRNMPDEHISAIKAHIKNLLGRFSTTTIMLESDLPTRVLQQKLTPSLASAIHLLQTELEYAAEVEIPVLPDQWVSIQMYDVLLRLVARISARVFVGPDLCRNKEWLHATIHYTENVFMTVMTLRMFPPIVHSVLALLMPSYWRIHANLRSAKRLISPIVRERRAAAAEQELGTDANPDLLQMMMDLATEQEGDPDKLAHRQLLLSLASIHTTTMATAHAIYDLCAHPEYLEPLQQEVNDVFAAEGSLGKASLNKLRRLDSFMKESQRLNPPSQLAFNRVVQMPLKLSDGTCLPVGTHFSMASDAIMHDSDQLPGGGDPEVFDPFRYVRLREDPDHPENLNRFQFAMTDNSSLHFGHGKFACPGRFFASNEIKLLLSYLLLRYDFKYPVGQTRPQNLSADENLYPDPSARVLIRKRQYA
ncbi:putative Cytochrome P450 monooxygenase [Seiridium cardinale]|uniref:Cytochrome P450 monooxygenase n=1 Tax=Seiridium cardinale TaxID=138064 RepID=A0ABR2XMU0_9PEZI